MPPAVLKQAFGAGNGASASFSSKNCKMKVKYQRSADPMTPRLRQIATMLAMVDDLNEVVRMLDFDIAAAELRARAAKTAEYSVLAMALASRGDNLRNTISLLEKRLARMQGVELLN